MIEFTSCVDSQSIELPTYFVWRGPVQGGVIPFSTRLLFSAPPLSKVDVLEVCLLAGRARRAEAGKQDPGQPGTPRQPLTFQRECGI